MIDPLKSSELESLSKRMDTFRWYTVSCNGTMPEPGTDDYIRLARAFLAWSAASTKWYVQRRSNNDKSIPADEMKGTT